MSEVAYAITIETNPGEDMLSVSVTAHVEACIGLAQLTVGPERALDPALHKQLKAEALRGLAKDVTRAEESAVRAREALSALGLLGAP